MTIDYTFTKVNSYDGRYGKRETAIETFNANTGETIGFVRRNPFEKKADWINRAIARATEGY